MEEKSFLTVLKKYFSSKADNEILAGNKGNIIIPMEWIFTEKIDREIIQRAMVQVLIEHRPDYIENYVYKRLKKQIEAQEKTSSDLNLGQKKEYVKGQALRQIKDITLNKKEDSIELSINGLDNWTKAVISENPNKDSKILQISEDEFCEKILGVLKADSIKGIVDSLDIPEEEKEHLQTMFANTTNLPLDEYSLTGIKESMTQAAENLTKYYDYLYEEKKKSNIHRITINQRQDARRGVKNHTGRQGPERKSLIYPFVEREAVLREMNPTHVINVDGIDEDGQIVQNVYTAFMYKDPLNQGGKLLIAEPLEGAHLTRIVYLDKDKVDGFEIPEGLNINEAISKQYLEMSNEEFAQVPNAARINHSGIDEYKDKVKYIAQGITAPSIDKRKWYFNGVQDKLYTKLTASDIGKLGEKALSEEEKIAETILDALGMGEKEVGTKEEHEN